MLTIAWDIDDVLNGLMRSWFSQVWKASHSACNLSYSEINENPPHRVLGISKSEYLDSLDVYRASDAARNLQPNSIALTWLLKHGAEYRHIALTARPLDSAPHAAEWLFRHFGTYIRSFAVAPTRLPNDAVVYDRDKADFLRWFEKADILVDDSEENISAAEKLGVRGVLYPQPWNHSSRTPEETLESLTQLAEAR